MEALAKIQELEDEYFPLDGNSKYFGESYLQWRNQLLKQRADEGYFFDDVILAQRNLDINLARFRPSQNIFAF
jgi:hypothetical protein